MKKIGMSILPFLFIMGCGKEFLEIKRDSNQVVPNSVKDYVSIVSNRSMLESSLLLSFIGADEFYYGSHSEVAAMARFSTFQQFAYVWGQDIFTQDEPVRDWFRAYENIMYANLALDVEKKLPAPSDNEEWMKVRVAARFFRAWNYYQLAQQFCETYDIAKANKQLGLPLRIEYDVSTSYGRSRLQEVYDLILKDLNEANEMDLNSELNIYMPGKDAVEALLGRVYLQIGNYDLAEKFATNVLSRKKQLVDYKKLNKKINNIYESQFEPMGQNNPSIIFYSFQALSGLLSSRMKMDSSFVKSFQIGDLRKSVYFFNNQDGSDLYTGSYTGFGVSSIFTGLSVEEMILIRAECLARKGDQQKAIDEINYLRKFRFSTEEYKDYKLEEIGDVLMVVLEERRKELYMRGMRWQDARRMNREKQYPIEFKRKLDDKEYRLQIGSSRWVWPIPPPEIINNNLEQNKRY